jgi:Bifunctional DNA primase/polymerase, N-terminal/Primase C terminal 1 (PriCT-1)
MTMVRSALRLAAQGAAIFPCRCRDKIPATAHGLKDATRDPEQIRAWWNLDPNFNVAIATGAVSKIFVIDVDGPDAERELQRLDLPATVEAVTARGKHLYFKYPGTPIRNTTGKVAPGVDTRGDGGYVLAPPSIHPSGALYRWAPNGARIAAAAPDQLIARISERTNGKATPAAEWQQLFASDIPEGQRDCTLTKMAGKLLRHCVNAADVLGIMQAINIARCRPPLPPEDIERIVESIAGRELKRRGRG